MKRYVFIARVWSILFFVAGTSFIIIPNELGQILTAAGNAIGLTGSIEAAPRTLWHILTLSLMGTITALAWLSARNPENKTLLNCILIAKSVSVAGFLVLAFTIGTAWLLCAATDAFVAITLYWAYPKCVGTMPAGFAAVHARAPHYEVWYGKIDIAPQKAFWFRYTILDGVRSEASAWAIAFYDGLIKTGKNTLPLSLLAPANSVIIPDEEKTERYAGKPQVFHLGKNHLDSSNAVGAAGNISWNLQFKDNGHRFEHVPPLVKLLGVAKSVYNACFLDLRFSGTIRCGSETFELNDCPGMIGHIHGKKSAEAWAWAHCNNFKDAQGVIFEGLSAQIKRGQKISSPLTSILLFTPGNQYIFSSVKHLRKTKSVFGNGAWEFEAASSSAILKGIATAPGNVALVEYTDTDDSKLWCHNSKLADLQLELTDIASGKKEYFNASATAAFELVNRKKPDRKIDL